jgi:4-amino-4-deoxy-L-arabinose transferase-like glycosyltransferase
MGTGTSRLERTAALLLAISLLAGWALPLATAGLAGPVPLLEPSEARYAEISREMLLSGDWLTPRLNGFKHLHKPPLTYWVTAGSMKLFGINEWGARLPMLFSSLAVVVLTFGLARSIFGRTAALLSAAALSSFTGFLVLSRMLATDAYLLLFVTAGLYCAWMALSGRPGKWIVGFWICAALGILTKGPLGLLLPLVPAAAAGLFFRRRASFRGDSRPLRWSWHLGGAALAALIVVPWYAAVCRATPAALPYLLGKATGPLVSARGMHGGPPTFYIPVLLGGLLPWSLLLPQAFVRLFNPSRGGWQTADHEGPDHQRERLRAAALFLTSASLGWIGFFSAVPPKLPAYILPCFVPLAIIIGPVLTRALEGERRGIIGLHLSLALLAAVTLGLGTWLRAERAAYVLDLARGHLLPVAMAGALFSIGGWLAVYYRRQAVTILCLLLAPASIYTIAAHALSTTPGTHNSPRALVAAAVEESPHAADIINLRVYLRSLNFYTGRRVVLIDYPMDIELEEDFAEPPARFPVAVRNYFHRGEFQTHRLLHDRKRSLWVTWEEQMPYVRRLKGDVEELMRLDGLVLFADLPRGPLPAGPGAAWPAGAD